jgi:hypothetical protein
MAEVVRNIGLSLGADICWPLCFEGIMKELDLAIPIGGDTVRFQVERVMIEPFNLRQGCKYDVVVDRLTHWYHTSREWIKKAILMDGLYVFNNPWSVQANEKHTSYCAMMKLGMRIPETWMIPPKSYEPNPDLKLTLGRHAKLFDITLLGKEMGWPLFMKPYDGGGWRGVTKLDDAAAMRKAYDESGKSVMHIQQAVHDFDAFVRCIGFGPQTHCVFYDPAAPLHERYTTKTDFMTPAEEQHLRKITLTINSFFDWEFNSCETLRKDGLWYPIDFANPCPDSQVTSLHWHFPWLVKAYVRWVVFCAATKRKMRRTQDWQPFLDIAAMDMSFEEKLDRYVAIADERFQTDRFDEFCAQYLGNLDEVTWEFFASAAAKDAVRQKVTALFPQHEIEKFTEHFWERIQDWRKWEEKRIGFRVPEDRPSGRLP